ncbi:MAG TPA: PspA/IM30 family protein [Oceanospirillales bacterium]|nr:PspA/IM30 family protein [Oceanospirillales bacterium]
MNILKKIMTAIRGGTRELGESIVDSQGTRIFAQEIEDAKESLKKAKHDLTQVMAKEMQAARKVEILEKEISKNEAFVTDALGKNKEALALEIAQKVAELEQDRQVQFDAQVSYGKHIEKLKGMMEKAQRQLNDYERQLTMVKTTENVQKATAAITDNFGTTDSTLVSAKESLERIKQKQQDYDDRNLAAEKLENETNGKDLTDKMKDAGIGEIESGAQAVLARLKAKKVKKKA